MKRAKSVNFYFETFVEMADHSLKAAELLSNIVNKYNVAELQDRIKEMHSIEHSADKARHKMIKKLAKEFITPIEREDIMAMADAIDTVTDTIEDVLMRMYMYNVKRVKENAIKMTSIIVKACNLLIMALADFHNFRKSTKLHELIVEINRLEEEGDALYTEAIKSLYTKCADPKELLAWDTIYHYLEKCCDSCEEVADVIENIIMKNS